MDGGPESEREKEDEMTQIHQREVARWLAVEAKREENPEAKDEVCENLHTVS